MTDILGQKEIVSTDIKPAATPLEVNHEALIEELQKDSKVQELIKGVKGLFQNQEFLIDRPWIEHAIKGLIKPDIEVRLEKQLKKTVRKKMMDEASEKVEPGESIMTPTAEAIDLKVNEQIAKRKKDIKETKESKLRKARMAVASSTTE